MTKKQVNFLESIGLLKRITNMIYTNVIRDQRSADYNAMAIRALLLRSTGKKAQVVPILTNLGRNKEFEVRIYNYNG